MSEGSGMVGGCRESGEGEGMSEWQETDFGRIPNEWGLKKIADIKSEDKRAIAMGPFGSNIKAENFVEHGVPVIRGTNFNFAKYVGGNFVYLTEEKVDDLLGSNCKAGDIVFTHRGTIGQVGLIPAGKYPRYVISQSGMKLTVNPDLMDNEFLFYFFKSEFGQHQILKYESQVGVPSISNPLTSLKEIKVPVPPPLEQKAIAAVLSSLDDKIDLLHRQNKTLEAMAATLFRQWFVEEAKEDWDEGVVSDLVEFNPPRKLSKGIIAPYFEIASLSTETFNPEGWYDREFSSGTKFMNGDTLLARITPCLENGKTAYVTILDKDQVGWGSTEYIVMRPKGDLHPFFAYLLSRNSDFRDFAEGCLAGSSGRQRVETNHLMSYKIKIPSDYIVKKFNAVAESTSPKLHSNAVQIRTLEKLRDTLLPKLMSGEVRVE